MTRIAFAIMAVCWLGGAVVRAQVPATPAPPAPAPAAADDNLPSPPADFSYSADGRRDPFMTLTRPGRTTVTESPDSRPAGAAGILVEELVVNGIVLSNGNYVAMVSGPAKHTVSVRPGTRLFDGTVQSITPRAVVIIQQVSDPLSPQKQREVRKLLRTQEEGK